MSDSKSFIKLALIFGLVCQSITSFANQHAQQIGCGLTGTIEERVADCNESRSISEEILSAIRNFPGPTENHTWTKVTQDEYGHTFWRNDEETQSWVNGRVARGHFILSSALTSGLNWAQGKDFCRNFQYAGLTGHLPLADELVSVSEHGGLEVINDLAVHHVLADGHAVWHDNGVRAIPVASIPIHTVSHFFGHFEILSQELSPALRYHVDPTDRTVDTLFEGFRAIAPAYISERDLEIHRHDRERLREITEGTPVNFANVTTHCLFFNPR